MAKETSAFVIPAGLQFEYSKQGIVITHKGDILLQGELGTSIQKITSLDGDVHISIPLNTQEIHAPNGTVFIHEKLTTSILNCNRVSCTADLSVTESLIAHSKIDINGALESPKVLCKGDCSISKNVEVDNFVSEGETTMGGTFDGTHVHIQGSLSIAGEVCCRNIEVLGNSFNCNGSVKANEVVGDKAKMHFKKNSNIQLLRADHVHLEGKKHSVKAIQVNRHIEIAKSEITSDIILCESVKIHPKASGKIMVLESQEQLGPHAIKGCLQLSDLEGLIPDLDDFLLQRGLHKQDPSEIPAPISITLPVPDETASKGNVTIPEVDEPILEEEEFAIEEQIEEPTPTPALINIHSTSPEPEEAIVEEVIDSSEEEEGYSDEEIGIDGNFMPSSNVEILREETMEEEVILPEEAISHDPIHNEIIQEILNVASEYKNEPPSAVIDLLDLMERGDFLALRDEIMKIWKRLLNYHQRQNTRLPPKVIDAFNQLNAKLAIL